MLMSATQTYFQEITYSETCLKRTPAGPSLVSTRYRFVLQKIRKNKSGLTDDSRRKNNKLTNRFNPNQFVVASKNGNSVVVPSADGAHYFRNISHVKKLQKPDDVKELCETGHGLKTKQNNKAHFSSKTC